MVGCRRGGAEGRRESHLYGAARGMESSEAAHSRGFGSIAETRNAGVRGTDRAPVAAHPECTIELEGLRGRLRIQLKNVSASYLATLSREFIGVGVLIQITPQLRILVAIEAIDGRKGIDSLAQLCREKLDADPFSGCLFIFRSRRAQL